MSSFEQVRRKLSKCLGIYVADTGRCGLGIFAAKPFPAGAAPDESTRTATTIATW